MTRLIDADALKEAVNTKKVVGRFNTIQLIDNAPTVDTTFKEVVAYECGQKSVVRPHGEWIRHIDNLYPEDSTEECPFCHEEQRLVGNDDNFCPNCGADMRGDRE